MRAGNARRNCVRCCPPEGGPFQIGALIASQEAWPEVARYGRKPVRQNRGGTPIDVRILLDARPCQQHGRLDWHLSAFRFPYLFLRSLG
jgi:hypothetical protein